MVRIMVLGHLHRVFLSDVAVTDIRNIILLSSLGLAEFAAMAQALDLVPWPPDASPLYAAPAVLIPLEAKKTMLAGVKADLYHPCLPTLRRMDMDSVANRLTDQHSRTSTMCCKGISPTELSGSRSRTGMQPL